MTSHPGRSLGVITGLATLAMLAASPAFAATAPAPDQTTLEVVSSAASNPDPVPSTGWNEQAYDCTDDTGPWLTPSQDFETGPGSRPVLGRGSHVMRTTQLQGDTQLFRTAQYDGTFADDIVHINYSTYSAAQSGTAVKQPAYLRLSFDTDGDNAPDASLYYEPALNDSDRAAVQNTWESWDTTGAGNVWSTDGTPDNTTSFQDWANSHPEARIENTSGGSGGGVSFIAGCAGQAQTNGLFGVDSFGFETSADHVDTTAPITATPDAVETLVDFDPTPAGTDNLGTVVVDSSDQHGWNASSYDYNTDAFTTPNQSFVFGPGTPPSGNGSRKLREGGSDVVELWRTTALDGVNVGDIRELSYSTYVQPDSGNATQQQPPTLRLSADIDGDGVGDATLFYEPSINHPNNIQQDQWQTWDTIGPNELWSVDGSSDPGSLITLAGFASYYPQAKLHQSADSAGDGGLATFVGSAGANQRDSNFYVDAVHTKYFDGTGNPTSETFDFEPTVTTPTISAPSRVVGPQDVTISGTADPNAPIHLFEKGHGASSFTDVANTTADENGDYSFVRHISKGTRWYVESYGSKDSSIVTTHVAVKVGLTAVSKHPGRLKMHATTSPNSSGETVRFYLLHHDGSRTLLAKETVNDNGGATARVDAKSGRTWKVMATVTPPPGNLAGKSPVVKVTIA